MRVTKLKMFGQTAHIVSGKFRFWFPEIWAGVVIVEPTDSSKASCTIIDNGEVVAVRSASGVVAARNAAQNWLVERAAKTLALAARSVR
jgi:hypothetical protein